MIARAGRLAAAILTLAAATACTALVGAPAAAATASVASAPATASVAVAAAPEPDGDDILVTVPDNGDATAITNAQLRWGLNRESGSGAFAGGCNFLSAGLAGDAGSARYWTEGDGLYRAADGAVRIEKPNAAGEWTPASFANRCLDPSGRAVSVSSLTSASGNQVVMDGGVGSRVAGIGLEIRWSGSFTIVFYGGLTYWSISDPVLTLDADGNGRVIATASGYGTSMDDMTKWEPLPERSIVIAELRGADVAGTTGFAVVPEYLGVATTGLGQVPRTSANSAHWGSFPATFMEYQRLTGQLGYWTTTGGQRDPAKPATALYISYDASLPAVAPELPVAEAPAADPVNGTRFRPVENPVAAVAAGVDFLTGTPLTTLPERPGLVPQSGGSTIPGVVGPALGAVLAILTSIVCVLHLMGALPWQVRFPLR